MAYLTILFIPHLAEDMKICRSESVSFASETFTKVRKGTWNDLLNVIRKPVLVYGWIPYLRKTASIWN